jgi:hypothetical protein
MLGPCQKSMKSCRFFTFKSCLSLSSTQYFCRFSKVTRGSILTCPNVLPGWYFGFFMFDLSKQSGFLGEQERRVFGEFMRALR